MAASGTMVLAALLVTMAMVGSNPFPHELDPSEDVKEELNFQDMIRELFPNQGSRSPMKILNPKSRRMEGSSRNLVCHGMCQCYSRFYREYFCCQCLDNTCFPGDATVQLQDNRNITLSQLRLGHRILSGKYGCKPNSDRIWTYTSTCLGLESNSALWIRKRERWHQDPRYPWLGACVLAFEYKEPSSNPHQVTETGQRTFSRVIAFLDRRPKVKATYVSMTTEGNAHASLSGNHLVFKVGANNESETRYADDVQVGDLVYVSGQKKSGPLKTAKITGITREIKEGAYVPLTETGSLFVDGVLASCYASFDHRWSHWVLAPVRWFPYLFESEESQMIDGVRPYVRFLKWLARTLAPSSLMFTDNSKMEKRDTDLSYSICIDLYNALYFAALTV